VAKYSDSCILPGCEKWTFTKLSKSVEVHLGRQGRLVIPAALRQLLGFEEGDTLVAREEAGRLVLEKQEMVNYPPPINSPSAR
jgi:AbrB family looped-hinge helix DNA binding protein